uniref:hypothetical protein n=1 Tax=Methanosarcina mazei TaxID=2209 RepID=UPI001F44811C
LYSSAASDVYKRQPPDPPPCPIWAKEGTAPRNTIKRTQNTDRAKHFIFNFTFILHHPHTIKC